MYRFGKYDKGKIEIIIRTSTFYTFCFFLLSVRKISTYNKYLSIFGISSWSHFCKYPGSASFWVSKIFLQYFVVSDFKFIVTIILHFLQGSTHFSNFPVFKMGNTAGTDYISQY